MNVKRNSKLLEASFEAIGLYHYLLHYCKTMQLYSLHNDSGLITELLNSLKPSPNLDALLVELDTAGFIIYEPFSITVVDLEPKEKRDHSLDEALSGTWLAWVEYKANEKKSAYKSPESERRAYAQLLRDCDNNEDLAAGALVNAMAMNWHGPNADVYLKRLNNLKKEKNEQTTAPKLGRINTNELQQWLNS